MDRNTTMCFICGKPIPLELAKTNDYGQAVHEQCYVLRIKLEKVTTPVRKSSDGASLGNGRSALRNAWK